MTAPPRALPFSEEIERACIASCLLSPKLFSRLGLGVEDFHLERHKVLWRALDALHVEGDPVDLHTVAEELKKGGDFDKVGGLAYLAALDQDLPSLDHVETYAKRLRVYRRRRERILASEKYLAALYDGKDGIPELENDVLKLLREKDPDEEDIPMAVDVDAFLSLSFPPRQWLVDGLIQEKDAGMIHAWRGIGKTHFVLSLTWALVSGERFLRFEIPEPRGVLVIDGEMPREDLQERLKRIVSGSPGSRRAPLRILAADMFERGLASLATPEGQAIVDANLSAFPEIRAVVVDNISTLCSTGAAAENEAESWNAVQEFVLRLRRRGISVIFVHHSNKNLSQRGTSKREDILSWVLDLRRPDDYREEDGARFELRFSKARAIHGEAAQPLDVQLIDAPGGGLEWSWRPVGPSSSTKEEALSQLEEGLSMTEVAKALGVNRTTVYRWKKEHETNVCAA